ncbi:hypothetical protein [Rhodococcus zopfii]|uniref:hypothetical protein n=1 Tax=Rhodococcus zopfii TaxID=43772 RepID=UPI00093216F4|nr:hypothetical protein [Rhodococcus zopfii]
MTSIETIAPEHLTIYPSTDEVIYFEDWIAGGAFDTLLEWAREEGFTLIHDPESDEKVTGYFIWDADGKQIAMATLTNH